MFSVQKCFFSFGIKYGDTFIWYVIQNMTGTTAFEILLQESFTSDFAGRLYTHSHINKALANK